MIDHFGRGLTALPFQGLIFGARNFRTQQCGQYLGSHRSQRDTPPIDVLETLIPQADGVGLSLDIESKQDITKHIEIAKTGNIAFCSPPVESVDEGNEITRFVRKHSLS